jgi:hypothetical protein
MAKKASKKSPTPAEADPRPVLATQAHYRQAVVRLVRRQLDCARRGLIGSDEWFLAYDLDFGNIKRYASWARFPAPHIERVDDPENEENGYPGRNDWTVSDGIPLHSISQRVEAIATVHYICGDVQDPVVLAALNLRATHVLSEWLEWVETAPERNLETDMMPASFFEPIKTASADNLRKWRDAGKISGTKSGSGKENLFSVASVLKHLKLPATMRDRLDAKWIEVNVAEDERKELGPARSSTAPRAESRGNSRPTHLAPR